MITIYDLQYQTKNKKNDPPFLTVSSTDDLCLDGEEAITCLIEDVYSTDSIRR